MNNSKLSPQSIDGNRISSDEKKDRTVEDLILPERRTIFPSSSSNKIEKIVSLTEALLDLRARVPQVDVTPSETTHGTGKIWQIDLFYRGHIGSTAFLACHKTRQFTTFSIHFEGCELWFDQYDAVLAFLSKRDAPNHIVDIVMKYKPEPAV